MLTLSGWTSLLDFLALAASLWLGLYVVTRSPRSRVSWLAGLTLWSFSGYFFDSFMHLNPPGERGPAWWTGWTILFSSPLWFHVTTLLLPKRAGWHRALVWAGYAWALALLVVEQATGKVFGVWTGHSFAWATAQQPGAWYPSVFLLLTLPPVGSVVYLVHARSRSLLRSPFTVLILATLFALLGGAYLSLGVWLGLGVPLLPGQAALATSLALLGYGVVRYNALVEGRSSRADFVYALVAIGAVVTIYVVVAYVSYLVFEIPFAVYILILLFVIVTHTLYEWGGTTLERLVFRRRSQRLRANLTAFAREVEEHDLEGQLHAVASSLCGLLGYARGWIALREANGMCVAAAHPPGHDLPDVDLLLDAKEVAVLPASDLSDAGLRDAVVVPLRVGADRLGVLVLGDGEKGRGGVEGRDLDLLETMADQIAGIVYAGRRQSEDARQIEALVGAFRERERQLRRELRSVLTPVDAGAIDEETASGLHPLVEDALRHLYDYAYLGELGLASRHFYRRRLAGVDVVTSLDRGRALSQELVEVIERLRPPGPTPKVLTREWVQYTILHDAYVLGEPNRDIMLKLYISESSFNRARRRAVRGVTRAVAELERAARGLGRPP